MSYQQLSPGMLELVVVAGIFLCGYTAGYVHRSLVSKRRRRRLRAARRSGVI
jgi:hypothetical protein